jgi:hypothetical protein
MSKIFIHLGAHKTATTFVQRNLAANADVFEKQGWKLIWFQVDYRKARQFFVKLRGNKKLKPRQEKLLDTAFQQIQNDPGDIILTYEGFLGSSSMQQGKLYASRAVAINILKEKFSGRDIKIGFCIRNFSDYIESTYNYRVSVGQTKASFARYIKSVSVRKLSWFRIIENLSDAFGAENLVLWTYEDFKKDSATAFSKIVQAAGIDAAEIATIPANPQLVSLTPAQTRALKSWHDTIRTELTLSPGEEKTLKAKLHALLEELPRYSETEGHFEPKRRKILTDHYKKDLAAIRERWGNQMLNFDPSPQPDQSAVPRVAASGIA